MNFNVFTRVVGGLEIISNRMSYRNHYMCSGEATSIYKLTSNKDRKEITFRNV